MIRNATRVTAQTALVAVVLMLTYAAGNTLERLLP